jgi:hypothetical protein
MARKRVIEMLLLVVFIVACGPSGWAQTPVENDGVEEIYPPEMSREEWREQIRQAKQRARKAAIEGAKYPEPNVRPSPEDPDRVATDRVLNDDSLQHGDIISTKNGLFVFKGRNDRERREGDFVALPTR